MAPQKRQNCSDCTILSQSASVQYTSIYVSFARSVNYTHAQYKYKDRDDPPVRILLYKADRHFVDSDVDSRVDERWCDPPCGLMGLKRGKPLGYPHLWRA